MAGEKSSCAEGGAAQAGSTGMSLDDPWDCTAGDILLEMQNEFCWKRLSLSLTVCPCPSGFLRFVPVPQVCPPSSRSISFSLSLPVYPVPHGSSHLSLSLTVPQFFPCPSGLSRSLTVCPDPSGLSLSLLVCPPSSQSITVCPSPSGLSRSLTFLPVPPGPSRFSRPLPPPPQISRDPRGLTRPRAPPRPSPRRGSEVGGGKRQKKGRSLHPTASRPRRHLVSRPLGAHSAPAAPLSPLPFPPVAPEAARAAGGAGGARGAGRPGAGMSTDGGFGTAGNSDAQQSLQSFWPRVMEEIRNLTVKDFRVQELPLARIKKIMKLDEDVKMISAEAPVLFAKAAQIFITELTLRAWIHTEDNKRRTLQLSTPEISFIQNQ
ncbi:hypothetical protein DV515_00016674 [Chloebia gouldiae]|uniref:Nuclear transcription factor Y subunit gamma n=1 Tax=Chloebia gouldiae TaxID=44316 RepID=A0A3L8RT91_CHLGU|nr:hypothetical protein DV515_00016674 [Chloebia gouldiae]